jgi:hypothetical protein
MDNRRIATITNIETGTPSPAEVRTYVAEDRMVVLYREFASGHLTAAEFFWREDKWVSEDGKYESDYTFDKTMNDVTVRVSR